MAEDDLAQNGPSWPAGHSAVPSDGREEAGGYADVLGESAQKLPPPQALPPAQGFSPPPPRTMGPAMTPPPGYGTPAGYPPGYPAGYGTPAGYGPPGYPPVIWPAMGWGPFGFAPLPPSPFGAGYMPGGLGLRFVALVIDAAFVLATLLLADLLIVVVDGASTYTTPAAMAISLLWLFFVLSYHPASWYVFDCTLGQRALGLRVRRRSDGQSLGFGAVNVRYVVFCVETLIFPLGLIAGAMAANDPMKRTWHDEAAGSVVVKRL